MSKAWQRATLAEGVALGVLALGRESFTGQKTTVELAFQHAWRDWPSRDAFPQVSVELAHNDLLGIIHDHPRQHSGTGVAGWSSEWPFRPYLGDTCELDEAGDILGEVTGVPLSAWTDLARRFLGDLDRYPKS